MEASSSKPSRTSPPKAKSEAIELPGYEEALEQGYIGVAVDERPNEDYTVEGVAKRADEGPPDITAEALPSAP